MTTTKAIVRKDHTNGVYDLIYPDGTKKWYYDKKIALQWARLFNSGEDKERRDNNQRTKEEALK